jgi:hypothetical protein
MNDLPTGNKEITLFNMRLRLGQDLPASQRFAGNDAAPASLRSDQLV